MIRALLALLLLCTPASAHDALIRAGTLAQAKAFLTFLGDTDISLATPYAQGQLGGVTYFLVFAGGGTGRLHNADGSNYDTGYWAVIRYQGDLGGFKLPTGVVAYIVDGLAVVASGGDGVTTITDTFNQTPTTPTQPPAAVIASETVIE